MNTTPTGGTSSPFAARARVPLSDPSKNSVAPATPAGEPEAGAAKKSPAVWLAVAGFGLVGALGAAWFFLGEKPAPAPALAESAPASAPAVATVPAVAPRDARADYAVLAARAATLRLEAPERAALAAATLRASAGEHEEAVAALGPLVARGVEAEHAERARDLAEIKLDELTASPAAQRLRLALVQADKATRDGVWAESVARRDEASELLPAARTEITARLADVAQQAVTRGDMELATYFYERVLRLQPDLEEARAHLYAHKFRAGQPLRSPLGLELAYVPPGEFTRGSRAGEPGRDADETPAKVRLTRGVFFGVTEVTQRQWDAVFGAGAAARVITAAPAGSTAIGPDLPMHSVRWDEARAFCEKLSELEGRRYRLPTEAEWEYAARAGTTTAFGTGADSLSAREANIDDGSAAAVFAPVAAGSVGRANAWGLRDLHGNVWEWCADWSAPYPEGDLVDPRGPADETLGRVDLAMRVVRGGGWNASASDARSANRWENPPVVATGYVGLRVVQEPELLAR